MKRVKQWDHWPFGLFYFPLFFVWTWYCIRGRSFWFFSSANPTLTFAGFEGESKSEMYEQLSKELVPPCIYIKPNTLLAEVAEEVKLHRFEYPFIVKPNVGMKGILFRKIDNFIQLKAYHNSVPAEYIIQKLVELPLEVSVFYYRYPDQARGCISGFIEKELLQVRGNGHSTIGELIAMDPVAQSLVGEVRAPNDNRYQRVLADNELSYLSFIANRYHGAKFRNLKAEIDDRLLDIFDGISHKTQFYYGRYDIKCASVHDLKYKSDFLILEFNGAGSIPNHIYAGGFTLITAYKEIARHWKVLYEISRFNKLKGLPYWRFSNGYRFLRQAKRYFRHMVKLDQSIP